MTDAGTAPRGVLPGWDAAAAGRLFGGQMAFLPDANDDWTREAGTIATRARALVRNDPASVALKNCKLTYTHGSDGMRFRSLVDPAAADPDNPNALVTTGDRTPAKPGDTGLRDEIEGWLAECHDGTSIDGTGMLTSRQFDEALDELATVDGDAFAVFAWMPNRPGAVCGSCWKMIPAHRVDNPPGESNSPTLYHGIVLDPDVGPTHLWIAPADRSQRGDRKRWMKVPWRSAAGLPLVHHRIGIREPGAYRGVSCFAADLPRAKQIKHLLDSYIIAKRIQACHPIFIRCENPLAAAAADSNGVVWGPNTRIEPGKVYYIGTDGEVSFPTWSFQGADLGEFLNTIGRERYASWGMPLEVVLHQMGDTNMAASRSAWLQLYRTAARWQNNHIDEWAKPRDTLLILEGVARGRIRPPRGMTLHQLTRGKYLRPPRSMPDPFKEAQAVEKWVAMGRDKSGTWDESGVDFRDSTAQRQEDDTWSADYSSDPVARRAAMSRDSAFIERVAAAQAAIKDKGIDLPWSVVIAATAAETAPGAFIGALAQQEPAADPPPAPAPAPAAEPAPAPETP